MKYKTINTLCNNLSAMRKGISLLSKFLIIIVLSDKAQRVHSNWIHEFSCHLERWYRCLRCHEASPRDPFQGPFSNDLKTSCHVFESSCRYILRRMEATGRRTRAIRKCRDAFRGLNFDAGFAPVVTIARHVLRGLQPALTRVRRDARSIDRSSVALPAVAHLA